MATDYQEMTVDELRDLAKEREIGGIWDMTKSELVEILSDGSGGNGNGRSGGSSAKEITSTNEHEDRPGQTLRTSNHEVIMSWAEERGAEPATVPGTEHGDRLGVLRFDFPDYGGESLEKVSWDEWFRTFDERNLTFIYQEHKSDGNTSNFFRLLSPDREDG